MNELKARLVGQCKRILKKKKPSSEVYPEIESGIIDAYNVLTKEISKDLLKKENNELFRYIRQKVVKAFTALGVRYRVPILPGIQIIKNEFLKPEEAYSEYSETVSDIESDIESDKEEEATKTDKEEEVMPQTKLELAKFINGEITTFEDDYSALDSLVNQIKIVEEITETTNIKFALDVIRSRIKNASLTKSLEVADSFDGYITILKSKVLRPSSFNVKRALKTFRQGSLTNMEYGEELKKQSRKLKELYMEEGVSAEQSEKYVIAELMDSIKENANENMLKMTMTVANFDKVDDVLNKVMTAAQTNNVFWMNKKKYKYKKFGQNFKGNSKKFYKNKKFKPNYSKSFDNKFQNKKYYKKNVYKAEPEAGSSRDEQQFPKNEDAAKYHHCN